MKIYDTALVASTDPIQFHQDLQKNIFNLQEMQGITKVDVQFQSIPNGTYAICFSALVIAYSA